MSWQDDLLPASFDDLEFDVINVDDDIEKTVAPNRMPYVDGSDPEDMGTEHRISWTAVFNGDDYEDDLTEFLQKHAQRGPRTLVHPIFGVMRAQVLRLHPHHDESQPNYCEVQVEYLRADQGEVLFSLDLPSNQVATVDLSVGDVFDAAQAQFSLDIGGILGQAASLQAEVLGQLQGAIDEGMDLFNELSAPISGALALVTSSVNFLLSPVSFVTSVESIFAARLDFFFGDASALLSFVGGFSLDILWSKPAADLQRPLFVNSAAAAAAIATGAVPVPVLPALLAHQAIQISLAVATASARVFEAEIGDPTMTPDDIDAVAFDSRTSIAAAIAAVRAAYPDIDVARRLTEPLKTVALSVSNAGRALLRARPPFIQRATKGNGSLHLVAFQWYGDHTRATELLRFNPQIRNPNLIDSGTVLNGYAL